MSVNLEIKGMLARLLATEDLIVEHKNVETACFNVHTRVLTLPMWKRASNIVYDMLVSHEVSHALYSPDANFTSFGVPPQFVNVVEDVRVEKLIKRRYMGLAKTFYGAYKELQEQDFFSLEDEDVPSMNLADRVNLFFKVGNFIDVEFTAEEQELVDEIAGIETFEETLIAAKKLYDFCKKDQKEQQKLPEINSHQQESGSGQEPQEQTEISDDGDTPDQGKTEEIPEVSQEDNTNSSQLGGSLPSPIDKQPEKEPDIKTMDSLQKSIENLIKNDGYENHYVEIPSLNLDTVVAKNKEIHQYIDEFYMNSQKEHNEYMNNNGIQPRNIFEHNDIEYQKFKTSAQKEVNYLVKEFECRKAADSYARASVSKTGVLDCSKLHTYKFNEDLFRKVTTLSEGKNHGLVFILDWSGSMSNVILDTIKQLYNLVWFCKKVSIPFEVYAFTGEWTRVHYDEQHQPILPKPHYTKKPNTFCVDERFSLLNFLTSDTSGKVLEQQMKNLWRVAYSLRFGGNDTPHRLSLSGTPLNETMIALHSVIPDFQKRNKVQKVQCVILTDGEASPIPYHVEIQRNSYVDPYIGTRRVSAEHTFLRDRKLGTTYRFGYECYQFTDVLLRNLRDKFPQVNFIGMRIMEGRDVSYFVNRYCGFYGKLHDSVMDDWKKNKSFSITQSGYSKYFGLSSSSLSENSEFQVTEDATKSQIKSAFTKSLKSKKMNKKILGQFVEMIA